MPGRHRVKQQVSSKHEMDDAGIFRSSAPMLPDVPVGYCHTENDAGVINRHDAADVTSPLVSDTILPPPELFDTDGGQATEALSSFNVDVDGQMFLLPPPEEFDVSPSPPPCWPPPTVIPENNCNDEIVLPPPELFDNECVAAPVRTVAPDERVDCSKLDSPTFTSDAEKFLTSSDVGSSSMAASCDGDSETKHSLNGEDEVVSRSCPKTPSSGDNRIVSAGDDKPVNKQNLGDTNNSLNLEDSINSEVTAARDRLASDAMDKLDALCRTTNFETPASTTSGTVLRADRTTTLYTSIPVYHETASGTKARRRRPVADSWPGGLFFRDQRQGVSVDEANTKRHSADTSSMKFTTSLQSAIPEDGGVAVADRKVQITFLPSAAEAMKLRMLLPNTEGCRENVGKENFSNEGQVRSMLHSSVQRHRSLEPRDVGNGNHEISSGQQTVAIRSDEDFLDGASSNNNQTFSSPDDERSGDLMFYGEHLTASSKTAAVRKNLLEQATERRKGQLQVRATSTPISGEVTNRSSHVTTDSKCVEMCRSLVNVSLSKSLVQEQPVDTLSGAVHQDDLSASVEQHTVVWRPSVEVSRATNRRLRTERSMETMAVARPASIVLPSSSSTPSLRSDTAACTSGTGSPVRVFVGEFQVSGGPTGSDDVSLPPLPPSRSSSSTPIIDRPTSSIDTTDDDVSGDVTPAQADSASASGAPLCLPETSFDTSSELQSGRNTPSTMSVLTFPDTSNFELSSPGNNSGVTDSGIDTTASQQSRTSDRHFIVVAIDFGTTYSGYAFSFVRDPDSVHMMRRWEGGDPGVVNQKTPTTLLLEPNGKFHSFGYAARDFYHDLDAQEAKKWLFFEKFKMVLHYNTELNKETTIKAANGRPFLALSVFAHALRFFHDHALQELSDQSATTIVNEDIRWVITVPAIWKAPAKQFMRLAAYQAGIASLDAANQLLIALEPEAASIYVRRLRLYQLVPEPPYVAQLRREPTPDPSCSFDYQRSSDDEFSSEESLKYRTLPALHFNAPSSTLITVGHEVDIEGTRYMVVDCGGGTVDITVYEMESRYGCLKELHKATGGPFGSVGVDLEFERLLSAIFGVDFIETFKLKRPAGWVDLMAAFESRKRTASPFKNTPLNVALPFSFIDYHKKCRVGHVENAVRKYGSREVTWSSQGMLRLTVEAMRRLFQPTVDRIKQSIGDVLNHPNARDIRYMFLVGGFSESPMLQLEMRKEFSHLLKIIIPQDVALTILKGAAIFGMDPTVVGVRRSRLTYGVGVLNRFTPGKHPPSKKIIRDGTAWCVDVFDRFVAVDQEVSVGDIVVRSYAPARPGQRSTVIHIYCSDRPDVEFVTDNGVRRCGTLCLDLTDSLYHDPDTAAKTQNGAPAGSTSKQHGGKSRRREIRARMTFGDTEIRVDAIDLATGRSVRAGVDFLNK